MKLNRAWPEMQSSTPIVSPTPNQTEVGPIKNARVWPKSITSAVEQTVERSLNELLKESFPETPFADQPETEDPKEIPNVVQSRSVAIKNVLADPNATLWIAFGLLAFVMFVAINSLHQKIASLESWLHGRMMSSH